MDKVDFKVTVPLLLSQDDFTVVVQVFGAAIENSERAFETGEYKDHMPEEYATEVRKNFARYRHIHANLLRYVGKESIMISQVWTKEFFDALVTWAMQGGEDGK